MSRAIIENIRQAAAEADGSKRNIGGLMAASVAVMIEYVLINDVDVSQASIASKSWLKKKREREKYRREMSKSLENRNIGETAQQKHVEYGASKIA